MINRISFLFSENTPPISNDVYKIALVHERSPHLTKREVQRKFFDGEISDKVLAFSYWKQSESLSSSYQFNDELKESGEMEQVIKLLFVTQYYHRPIPRKVKIFFQIFFLFLRCINQIERTPLNYSILFFKNFKARFKPLMPKGRKRLLLYCLAHADHYGQYDLVLREMITLIRNFWIHKHALLF